MVVLLVDTESFVEASAQARSVAQLVGQAASRVESGLSGSSRMAGSDSHGLTWAGSYDQAAKQLLGYVAQVQDAIATLSTKLAVTGYYYELTESANAGVLNAGLSMPAPMSPSAHPHVPSAAGGHRRFPNPNPAMQWIAEGIANAIGNAWPDGDTAKLDAASKVWHRLADDLDDVASAVGKLPNALTGVNTPELSRIHDQVDGVRTFTKKLADACRELGTACNTLSGNIAYVHTQTEITVGITVGVIAATVAAALGLTVFTFGASDAIGVAGVAGETAGAVGTILGYIAEFGATISGAVGGITASAAGLVGISADLAGVIGATVGDITASAVVWGTAGATENVIVTKITEPDTGDLSAAFDEGFIGGAIGGGAGTAFGKVADALATPKSVTKLDEDARLASDAEDADIAADAEALGPLAPADLEAMQDYTGIGYSFINRAHRGFTELTPELAARSDAISTALSKLPDSPGLVFRGADLTPEQIAGYVPGTLRREAAFTSTSTDRYRAFGGNTLFSITSKHGKDIAMYSRHSESEILFDKGTSYYVLRNFFDEATGRQVIVMIEE